jgi:hypothetical protein
MKRNMRTLMLALLIPACFASALWVYAGAYGFNVLFHQGGSYWVRVTPGSPRLSPAMRLALRDDPAATPGAFSWRSVAPGFEVAELPAMAEGQEVDRIMLARIDPARFRFVVRNSPAGDRNIDTWMKTLGAALVVNGSYYAHHGTPATPVISDGRALGPATYNASAGAFVASRAFTGIIDLSNTAWQSALHGSDNALVSYPLLLDANGSRVTHHSRWLATRSFVGQDDQGKILIGTTKDGFFSLEWLAKFLHAAPLHLRLALNLDGGPVACQSIAIGDYRRTTYGRWEFEISDRSATLLTWPYGRAVGMPIVLAVFPK